MKRRRIRFVASLSFRSSRRRRSTRTPNPGRTQTFHRLNRTEYQKMPIRDLLSIDVDVRRICCRPMIRATGSTTSPGC